LLGARRVDGARQFFSRAKDFGFSKDYRQALSVWDHQAVLADVVRTIRTFRPDVIITRFPPWPSNTHGQHTASAVLALEAFKLAGDPQAFPEQLGEGKLSPWQPKRILWNSTPYRRRGLEAPTPPGSFRLDVNGYQPSLGEWFGVIAARSRSMQKTQGMGSVGIRGDWYETFRLLAGEPAARDIFEGTDRTWQRYPGGAEIGRRVDEILSHFNPQDPAASVPALLALRQALGLIRPVAPGPDPVLAEKSKLLDRILQGCLGLHVETEIADAEMVPGETLHLRTTVIVGSNFPVRWRASTQPGLIGEQNPIELQPRREASRQATAKISPAEPVSQPFWLRAEGSKGMFRVDASPRAIRPEDLPVLGTTEIFEVGGQTLSLSDEPVQIIGEPARGEIRRSLTIIPPAWVNFTEEVKLFSPGGSRAVGVEVTAARAGVEGILRVEVPAGWQVAPAGQPFRLGVRGAQQRFTFTVSAPARSVQAELVASAEVGGQRFRNRRVDIHYEHIPAILYQPVARLKAVSLELAIRGRRVGYLPGAGDRVPEALEEMGYAVTLLKPADLVADRLQRFDAVILGVRAFNVHADLSPYLPSLWNYVQGGGNVIVQYNTAYGLKSGPLAPWPLEISDGRITDENAPIRLLVPDHPALIGPNRIGPADFAGWVQERARYLPTEWDPRFTPLLAGSDPGEPSNNASLLVAHYGKGYYVYTGLAWFRELPAGVPGAYRLFANLVSLGK
jgi:hypothetical protein